MSDQERAKEIVGHMRNPGVDFCGCADCGTHLPYAMKLIAAALREVREECANILDRAAERVEAQAETMRKRGWSYESRVAEETAKAVLTDAAAAIRKSGGDK